MGFSIKEIKRRSSLMMRILISYIELLLYNLSMKNTVLSFICFLLISYVHGQEVKPSGTNLTVKWAPTGLVMGSLSFAGEYNFGGKSSLTAKIGIPVKATHSFQYDGDDADFEMRATSFLAGYRMYFSKKHMKGLYFEPYFKYVHHTSDGSASSSLHFRPVKMNFLNNYNGAGVGAQLGAQFIIKKRFIIDLFFLGPELNSSSNKFRASEGGSVFPWTALEAEDARRDIVDFVNQFPFLKNHTDVMVDNSNRTITANFNGALPGIRTGFSFGVAF
jgi:hypothetical protein